MGYIGELMAEDRQELGLEVEDYAKRLGISHQSYYDYLKYSTVPTDKYKKIFENYFKMTFLYKSFPIHERRKYVKTKRQKETWENPYKGTKNEYKGYDIEACINLSAAIIKQAKYELKRDYKVKNLGGIAMGEKFFKSSSFTNLTMGKLDSDWIIEEIKREAGIK